MNEDTNAQGETKYNNNSKKIINNNFENCYQSQNQPRVPGKETLLQGDSKIQILDPTDQRIKQGYKKIEPDIVFNQAGLQ